ncbi:hypothetical protein PAE9249_00014 [Paenibacillus sp. CECT 9249]|nr:hypothetical protein PAE9249_00014 [Paenibacillus sp. CECT 9249]
MKQPSQNIYVNKKHMHSEFTQELTGTDGGCQTRLGKANF